MENFYLLYGTDKSVIENELNKLIKKLGIDDIVKYSMDSDLIDDVVMDASTISMFSSKKIIILENSIFLCANKSIDKIEVLEEYINKYNKDSYLIFTVVSEKIDTRKKIYKRIKDNGKIIECNKGNNKYIEDYINDYLKESSYDMEDINYFVSIVGTNLDNIKNELDKLFMYKLDSKKISNSDIEKVVIKNSEEEIFSLTDAIILRDVKKALVLLDEFLNKSYDEIQILNLLASQFRFLFQVKRLVNKNKRYDEIAKILEANPYRVKFTIKKIYTYTEKDLIDRIKALGKIDHDIKFGLIDKRVALEMFILDSNDSVTKKG